MTGENPGRSFDVAVKPRAWEVAGTPTIVVTLRPAGLHSSTWEVYHQGRWIGTVSRYKGSLDRPIARQSRIRRPGKTRTLWSYRGPGDPHAMHGQYSRADCIRSLVHTVTPGA